MCTCVITVQQCKAVADLRNRCCTYYYNIIQSIFGGGSSTLREKFAPRHNSSRMVSTQALCMYRSLIQWCRKMRGAPSGRPALYECVCKYSIPCVAPHSVTHTPKQPASQGVAPASKQHSTLINIRHSASTFDIHINF